MVEKIVKDMDAIVHFAAESHVDRSIADSAAFIHTNVVGRIIYWKRPKMPAE